MFKPIESYVKSSILVAIVLVQVVSIQAGDRLEVSPETVNTVNNQLSNLRVYQQDEFRRLMASPNELENLYRRVEFQVRRARRDNNTAHIAELGRPPVNNDTARIQALDQQREADRRERQEAARRQRSQDIAQGEQLPPPFLVARRLELE